MHPNIGSQYFLEAAVDEKVRSPVLAELRKHFRPEFLNRVDEIVVFHSLEKEHIKKIVAREIKEGSA